MPPVRLGKVCTVLQARSMMVMPLFNSRAMSVPLRLTADRALSRNVLVAVPGAKVSVVAL